MSGKKSSRKKHSASADQPTLSTAEIDLLLRVLRKANSNLLTKQQALISFGPPNYSLDDPQVREQARNCLTEFFFAFQQYYFSLRMAASGKLSDSSMREAGFIGKEATDLLNTICKAANAPKINVRDLHKLELLDKWKDISHAILIWRDLEIVKRQNESQRVRDEIIAAVNGRKPEPAQPTQGESNAIRLEGAMWVIQFGKERGRFPTSDFKALAYLFRLVTRPHHSINLRDFVDAETGRLLQRPESSTELLDNPALEKLRCRYHQLQRDMAKEDNPAIKAENEKEMAQISSELRKALGPGGRKRKLGQTLEEKVWKSFTKSVRRLWSRIRKAGMPELAEHLERTIRFERPQVIYQPQPDSDVWITE
jgi:hypothetical protein